MVKNAGARCVLLNPDAEVKEEFILDGEAE